MAGRLTLIQSVTSSVPIYAMQTAKLPSSVCDSLDKLNRNFLWGDTNDKKKVHLLCWKKVCKPKCKGGLGLKMTADMNRAMLAKASWRITNNDSGLWCKILKCKYLQTNSILDSSYKKHVGCSSTWNSILHGAGLLRAEILWRVGNGCSIKFWYDNWTGIGPLAPLATDICFVEKEALVHDFMSHNSWI